LAAARLLVRVHPLGIALVCYNRQVARGDA
jgi:hypothetical protein